MQQKLKLRSQLSVISKKLKVDDTSHLIWIDPNINSAENQQYIKILGNKFPGEIHLFVNFDEAIRLIVDNEEILFTVITNGLYAKNFVEKLSNKLIIFCYNKSQYLELFCQYKQIIGIEDQDFNKVCQLAIDSANYEIIKRDIIRLHNPPQLQFAEYQHSKDHISLQFLIIVEELQKEIKIYEPDIQSEIIQLLTMNKSEEVSKQIYWKMYEDMIKKEKIKQQQKNKSFSLFEKLIYYYTRDEFYSNLNQCLARNHFIGIKQILCCLHNGYKELLDQKKSIPKLQYRGINFISEEEFLSVQVDLIMAMENHSPLCWNTLASTTSNETIAKQFALSGIFRILFIIEMDEKFPHPLFTLENYNSCRPTESEILLYPQFKFYVENIDDSSHILRVYIKQMRNYFAFSFDSKLRKLYWDNFEKAILKPKIKSIVKYNKLRIDFLLQYFKEMSQINSNSGIQQQKIEFQILIQQFLEEISLYIKYVISCLIKSKAPQNQNLIQFNILEERIEKLPNDLFYDHLTQELDLQEKIFVSYLCNFHIKGLINFDYNELFVENFGNDYCDVKQRQVRMIQLDIFRLNLDIITAIVKGTEFGPIGVALAGATIIASIFGFAKIKQLKEHSELTVEFSKQNYGTVVDGNCIDPGILPKISWLAIHPMVESLILIGKTKKVQFVYYQISKNRGRQQRPMRRLE